jgi:hypothetical protein
MDEKYLRDRADHMAADGFYLAIRLIQKFNTDVDSERFVQLLRALVDEDELVTQSLMNRTEDAVAAIGLRWGSELVDGKLSEATRRGGDIMFQLRLNYQETARAILRSLQRSGREVGMRPDDVTG